MSTSIKQEAHYEKVKRNAPNIRPPSKEEPGDKVTEAKQKSWRIDDRQITFFNQTCNCTPSSSYTIKYEEEGYFLFDFQHLSKQPIQNNKINNHNN